MRTSSALLPRFSAFFIGLGIVVAFALVPYAALADSMGIGGRPANPDPSNERTKSIFIKTINAGGTANDAVQVINGTSQTQTVLVYATDSTVSSGGAFACAQASDPVKAGGSWITMSTTSVTVPANANIKVPFSIAVPRDAEPGEQDACIILQQAKQTTVQSGIGLNFRTGIRVAMLVPGNVVKKLTPVGLTVDQNTDKVIVSPAIKNSGTVSVDATVHTQIQSLAGTNTVSQESVFPVLRGQTSEWNIELARPFWGGIFKATYSASYDKSNNFIGQKTNPKDRETVTGQTVYFLAFPTIGAAFIELIILAVLTTGIFLLVRKLKRSRSVRQHWVEHVVETEQLSDIAERHQISWKALAKANGIKAPYTLTAGQVIKVPSSTHHATKRKK